MTSSARNFRTADDIDYNFDSIALSDFDYDDVESRRLLYGEEDERFAVPIPLGFRILPKRAARSACILLCAASIILWCFGLVIYRVSHPDSARQHRCSGGDNTGALCKGTADNSTCTGGGLCHPDPCGAKLFAGMDISVAGARNGTSTPVDAVAAAMIAWSAVPYLLFVALAAAALVVRSSAALSPLALFAALVAVNEGLLKRIVRASRPEGSCLFGLSYGMPSGHACTSIGVLTYLLLETLWNRPELRPPAKAAIAAALVAVLAPVPYSRVYLSDHSVSQAVAGAAEGAALGGAWFVLVYTYLQPRLPALCATRPAVALGIRHTYRRRAPPLSAALGVWPAQQAPPQDIKDLEFSA